MFLGQMNLTPKTLWAGERAGYLGGQTTDGETGMVSSEFLKSGPGEYLTSRREEVKIGIQSHGIFAGAITLHKYATATLSREKKECGTIPWPSFCSAQAGIAPTGKSRWRSDERAGEK